MGIHTAAAMTEACALYKQAGFRRCPGYDLRASRILRLDESQGDVDVIAYRLDLAPRAT